MNVLPSADMSRQNVLNNQIRQWRQLDELPPPVAWCNYKGDCRGSIGQPFGPNLNNEWLTMVTCDYDPDSNKSRAGFAYGVVIIREEHDDAS